MNKLFSFDNVSPRSLGIDLCKHARTREIDTNCIDDAIFSALGVLFHVVCLWVPSILMKNAKTLGKKKKKKKVQAD